LDVASIEDVTLDDFRHRRRAATRPPPTRPASSQTPDGGRSMSRPTGMMPPRPRRTRSPERGN